jgi:hypothetical protein
MARSVLECANPLALWDWRLGLIQSYPVLSLVKILRAFYFLDDRTQAICIAV